MSCRVGCLQFLEDGAHALVVEPHHGLFDLLGGQIGAHCVLLQEVLKQHPHDLWVFFLPLAANEHFLDAGQPDVVLMLHPVDLQPFHESATCGLHLPLRDYAGNHGLIVG